MTQFWLNDPLILIRPNQITQILPNGDMNKEEKFNAITRLLIIVSLLLLVLGYSDWYIILILGLIIIIFIYKSSKEHFTVPGGRPPKYEPCGECNGLDTQTDQINRAYELTPGIQFNHDNEAKRSYMNTKYELTPLRDEPGFKDIWRNLDYAEDDNGFSMVPDPVTVFPEAGEDGTNYPQQCNYIVRSKIDFLPIVQDGSNGLSAVKAQAEQAFVDNNLLYRNNLQGEYVDYFVRERQHNCTDVHLMRTTAGS